MQPREYECNGTAKLLTLVHPSTGEVRVKGITSVTNAVLHHWLKEQLTAIVATLSQPAVQLSAEENRAVWESWREGLTVCVTLSAQLPPLRMLLIWGQPNRTQDPRTDALAVQPGNFTLADTARDSWLNMAESMQRIPKRRALEGQHPTQPGQIIEWLEVTARGWNAHPTPFEWGWKRAARRTRARERRHALGGSGACTCRPVRRYPTHLEQWQKAGQTAH